MPKVGWNAYKTINLKYTNQIVAEKYDPLEVSKAIKQYAIDSAAAVVPSVDSLIKDAIKEEIKKVEVTKKETTVKKETVANKESKPVVKEKIVEKPVGKTTEKTLPKSTKTTEADKNSTKAAAKTKEKTDTKKPL